MRIAIVSTRGVPNHYGGLEQFAEKVSVRLVQRGHEVIVYNPSYHPYMKEDFNGVKIIKKYSPEKKIGTAANFIYDYLSLRDAIHRKCDVILVCGYTTCAISYFFCPFKTSQVITNIDGMEWWRAKWNPMVQKLTQWFEKVAVEKSHAIVSDNMGIKDYVREHFNRDSYFIAYAADLLPAPDESVLNEFGLEKFQYHAMIGRLEPENNIEMILDGIRMSSSPSVTHIFANNQTKYGHYLMKKYSDCSKIKFMGWVSGQERLNNIRHYAKYYLHGHSVGGTNPSLLEAMAGGAFLVAHGNVFNKYVLGNEALYFTSPEEVKNIIDNYETHRVNRDMFIRNNIEKINKHYNWDVITDNYEKMFFEIVHSKN